MNAIDLNGTRQFLPDELSQVNAELIDGESGTCRIRSTTPNPPDEAPAKAWKPLRGSRAPTNSKRR